MSTLKAPFPWFGGKRRVAEEVWSRFGDVQNYVEPFFGSGAVLLGRPKVFGTETINDKDGFVSNFWRAIKHAPEETAIHADNPVNENDLHARHIHLVGVRDKLVQSLEGDPDFYDAKIAGFWAWGISCWIGGGFCSGKGPWGLNENRQLVHLGNAGQGVRRQLVHLGSAGQGVNRKLVHLVEWFTKLSDRLINVRVCSGDWARVCGPSVTFIMGKTAMFLDPPYSKEAMRANNIYAVDDLFVAHGVREYCIEYGKRNDMLIALCGYEGEHDMPKDWSVYEWNAAGGYEMRGKERTGNRMKERIWFSPACQMAKQGKLF